jgi:carbamoyl-phosphate synthase large subunit
MTDPGMAHITYLEPLTVEVMSKIIEKERPDALLPNLGGQSGLNLSAELAKEGILEKYGVEVIGVDVEAIRSGEDRIAFKETMDRLGIEMPKSEAVYTIEEGTRCLRAATWSMRPNDTTGGRGGLVCNARSRDDRIKVIQPASSAVLLESSLGELNRSA